jgi:cell division protease FtsH
MQLPDEDRNSHDETFLFNNLCTLLGGRIAEEIIFSNITTGSGNDIERVSDIARKMVCEWGMSKNIGPLVFKHSDPLQGAPGHIMSEETAVLIDKEVKALVERAYATAKELLLDNRQFLENLAQALLEKETITNQDIQLLADQ